MKVFDRKPLVFLQLLNGEWLAFDKKGKIPQSKLSDIPKILQDSLRVNEDNT